MKHACDFVELYRYLIDDFVVQYCQGLKKKDFVMKSETYRNRRGKREYLNDKKTRDFMRKLYAFFQSAVEIPRIRIGKRQEIETLIREEAWLFAKYLRKERKTWNPRIVDRDEDQDEGIRSFMTYRRNIKNIMQIRSDS